jgi:hypothetical protein
MARAKPVDIDTRSFRTQGEATKFFGHILDQYKLGERVREEHEPDLRAILKRHTEYQEKLGSGIAYFFVDRPKRPTLGDKCFWVCHTDGTKDDFSFQNCVTQIKRG